jgi:hypothetical protein
VGEPAVRLTAAAAVQLSETLTPPGGTRMTKRDPDRAAGCGVSSGFA